MTRGAIQQILGEWQRGDGPLYRRLAAALRAAIERGDLAAGARLPAQRVLARWLEVSRTTVVLARRQVGDPFVAVHTHMSLFRGTPDQSFGRFSRP